MESHIRQGSPDHGDTARRRLLTRAWERAKVAAEQSGVTETVKASFADVARTKATASDGISSLLWTGLSEAVAGGRSATSAADRTSPGWVHDAVVYNIFPDRFFNGDPAINPPDVAPWGSAPTTSARMGGDLAGIRAKLPYLEELGVNTLYLNPIFSAGSNHRYDTTDYLHVDPQLGGDDAFGSLVDDWHGRNGRLVLDGVFNHTGDQHQWFQDVVRRGRESPYWDYYSVHEWPVRPGGYDAWWGFPSLPKLRTDTAPVQNAIIRSPDSVINRWMREHRIDGWRMDVADEVDEDFWRIARTQIKANNPESWMVAEMWEDADRLLKGDMFDSVMNYAHFMFPARRFFGTDETSVDEFLAQLSNGYSERANFGMFNMLDSHDQPRLITVAGNNGYKVAPATIFQMTFTGVPVVYYGAEVGLPGGYDPDNRRAFPWNPADQDQSLLDLHKRLIAIRKDENALKRGDFSVLGTNNAERTFSYRRNFPGEARDVVVAINADTTGHALPIDVGDFAADGTVFEDLLGKTKHVVRDGRLHLPDLNGNFGAILARIV